MLLVSLRESISIRHPAWSTLCLKKHRDRSGGMTFGFLTFSIFSSGRSDHLPIPD